MNTRRTSRRWLAQAALATTLPVALVLSGCAPSAETSNDAPAGEPRTSIVIGSTYEHDGFDPMNPASASANGERLVPVFDTLLRVDTNGAAVPQLAASVESPDGATWRFGLREGVTFTDGTPLNADAVIYNLERHRAPDSPSSSQYLLADVVSMVAEDDLTVVITLGSPNFSFPYSFTASGALGLIGSPAAFEADPEGFNRAPIGAGPYIVEEWVPDDYVKMTANPDYWAGEPEIKELTYRVLPDGQSRENALVSGQLDITVAAGNFEAISNNSDLTVYAHGARGGMSLLPNTSVAPLDDQRIREAILIAFDSANSKQVFFGNSDIWDGTRGCIPFGAGTPQCEPSSVKTDVERAKQLVAEYVAEGKSAALEIMTTGWLGSSAEYVDQVLKSIGIESTINSVNPGDYIPTLYGGDFQLGMWQMVPFESFYPLGYTIFSNQARNVIQQQDAEFEAALQTGVNAATQAERDAGLREMQKQWNDKAYVTWISPMAQVVVSRADVSLGEGYLGGLAFYPQDISIG
ncbi:ABC transporter substrate-binding protein [Salinibacterium sp. ZJ70]|uniref:ABC transporter substrate-binding protein n=1 Tax=Salinibacterium sp. ZJ70 TaxID=2708084 RepID=UPI00141F3589|nr:ABC transporter substrate-binding protein [Salinibacterium sp. ZJ70]